MDPLTGALLSGGLSLVTGWFSHKGEKKAQKKQEKIAGDQMELTKEQYHRQLQNQQAWKEMYGGVERNLLNFVQGLDANSIYAAQEGSMRSAFDHARNNAESHLADRGFDIASGVHSSMFADIADREARAEIELRQASQDKVVGMQQAMLNGNPMPQDPSVNGQIGVMNTQSGLAAQAGHNATKNWDALAGVAGKAAGMFYNKYAQDNEMPEYKANTVNGYTG